MLRRCGDPPKPARSAVSHLRAGGSVAGWRARCSPGSLGSPACGRGGPRRPSVRQASEGLRLHTARPRTPHGQQLSQEKVAGGAIGHGDTVVIATSNVAVGVRPQTRGPILRGRFYGALWRKPRLFFFLKRVLKTLKNDPYLSISEFALTLRCLGRGAGVACHLVPRGARRAAEVGSTAALQSGPFRR